MTNLGKASLAEAIGTFTLVFIGAGAGALAGADQGGGGLVAVALAHGIALTVLVYAFGAISGCHVNPAVTFGLAITGKVDWPRAAAYWGAQFLGGFAAAWLLMWIFTSVPDFQGPDGSPLSIGETKGVLTPGPPTAEGGQATGDAGKAMVVEAVLTFFLITAVFGSAVAGRNGNAAGLAIGLVLAMDILMGGYLTGGSMNPARTFGPAVVMGDMSYFVPYLIAQLIGGGGAALLYEQVFRKGTT